MSSSLSQIEDTQSNSSKSNFNILPKSLNFLNGTDNQQSQKNGEQSSNYCKIYEKIQNIQMQNKSSNNSNMGASIQSQQSNDTINSSLSDSFKANNDQNNRYAHQKSLSQLVAPQFQQNSSKQIKNNNSSEISLPRISNQQSFTNVSKQAIQNVKRRSVSTQPLINNQGISSTTSNSSSNNQVNESPLNSYDSFFQQSVKQNQNINHLSNTNNKYYMNSIKPQNNHIQVNEKNNILNSFTVSENNNSQNFESNKNENSNPTPFSILNNREFNSIKRNIKVNMNSQIDLNRMKPSYSFQNDKQNQMSPVKELPLIKVNSILKKRGKDTDQDSNSHFLPTTNESEDEHNSSQIIAKDYKSAIPFINGLDMSDINDGEARIESHRLSHEKYNDSTKNSQDLEIIRKRCQSASPKKNVKFAENVQVCNLHTSTKTSYKLAQKEIQQEIIYQSTQLRKDLMRTKNQLQQQQQQKLKQEQLMFHLQELMNISSQNQPGSKSEVNLMKFAPTVQVKQYSKFKILSKLDKNQEQEQYLQKIEQIDKQYKQNLATKLQTTYSVKHLNQKPQQIQQLNQQPQQQQQQNKSIILYNNTLLKNLTPL